MNCFIILSVLASAFSVSTPRVTGDEMDNAVATWSEVMGTRYAVREASLNSGVTWTSPVTISNSSQHSITPAAVINNSDDILYLWVAYNGTFFDSFGASTVFGMLPSTSTKLSSGDSLSPWLAIDASGNGVAIWQQTDSSGSSVCAASYYHSIGWSPSIQLATGSHFMTAPVVAMRPDTGKIVALWQMEQNSVLTVQASTLSLGGGSWSTPQTLSSLSENATQPQVACNTLGETLGVWEASVGMKMGLQVSSYNGTNWGSPVSFSADGSLNNPKIAFNNIGEVVIVGEMSVGDTSSIVAITRSSLGVWGSVTTVSGSDTQAIQPKVALNDSHQAIIVWQNVLSTQTSVVRFVSASNLSNWGSVGSISGQDSLNTYPDLWMNASGFAVAVWKNDSNSQTSFQASKYSSGIWGAPETISD